MKILLHFIVLLSFTSAIAQKIKPTSTNEFIQECMKTSGEVGNKQIAIWLPYNFWTLVGDQIKVSPEFEENLVNQMRDYIMFCVVDLTLRNADLQFKSEEEIRNSIRLTDSSKNIYKPLEDIDISSDAKRLVQTLKPVMAQMLGQFGTGTRIYLFKAKIVDNQPSINVMTKNSFTLSWNSTSFTWKLPLSSILPPKYCPVDNEKMKGNWEYCPIHGVKLENKTTVGN